MDNQIEINYIKKKKRKKREKKTKKRKRNIANDCLPIIVYANFLTNEK